MKDSIRLFVVIALLLLTNPNPCEAQYYLAGSGFVSAAGTVHSSGYGSMNTIGTPLGEMSAGEDYLLIAGFRAWGDEDYLTGIQDGEIVPLPYGFWLAQNFPNPFNPFTRVRFSIPGRTGELVQTRIVIFDVLGRVVTVLADGTMPSGPHELSWNGTNAQGRKVASGVYFIRAKCGDCSAVRRIVVLR